jgi:2-hydroxychromene-2-carboxylate isomerase
MSSFEFLYDYGSPAAYLAWARLSEFEAQTGSVAQRKPILLGGIFQATGNQAPITVPLKGKHLFIDLQRWAKRHNTPFGMNPNFPINTLAFMRMATALSMREPERLAALDAAVFNAIWRDGKAMNDPAVAAIALQDAGFDAAQLMAVSNEPDVKEQLKATTAAAVARGAFGAPTFFVGNEMFWGQDRMDFVAEALQQQTSK